MIDRHDPIITSSINEDACHILLYSKSFQAWIYIVIKLTPTEIKGPDMITARTPQQLLAGIVIEVTQAAVFVIGNHVRIVAITLTRGSVIQIQHRRGLDSHQPIGEHDHVTHIIVRQPVVRIEHAEQIIR